MPRMIRDAIGSVLTLIVLFALLASFDPRVRDRAEGLVAELSSGAWQPPSEVRALVGDVREPQHIDNAYLGGFLVAGVVLVFLMLRT